MAEPRPVDEEATAKLAALVMAVIREHYMERPVCRDTTLEILNSLAAVVATVIAGTSNDPEARKFYEDALAQNLKGYAS